MAAIVIRSEESIGLSDGHVTPDHLHSVESLLVSDVARLENIRYPIRAEDSAHVIDTSRRLWFQIGNVPKEHRPNRMCRNDSIESYAHKIDPILRMPTWFLDAGASVEFQLEDYISGSSIQDLMLRIRNPQADSVSVTITRCYTNTETGLVDEMVLVQEDLLKGSWVDFVPAESVARSIRVSHNIVLMNNDSRLRIVYATLNGWRSISTKQPSFTRC